MKKYVKKGVAFVGMRHLFHRNATPIHRNATPFLKKILLKSTEQLKMSYL